MNEEKLNRWIKVEGGWIYDEIVPMPDFSLISKKEKTNGAKIALKKIVDHYERNASKKTIRNQKDI